MTEIALGLLLTVATTVLHGSFTVGLLNFLRAIHADHWTLQTFTSQSSLLSLVGFALVLLAVLEAMLWAVVYLAVGAFEHFESALYFSLVTFTTLGYGDVTLGPEWRLLSGFQSADGIIKFGWSTALIVFFLRKIHEARSGR